MHVKLWTVSKVSRNLAFSCGGSWHLVLNTRHSAKHHAVQVIFTSQLLDSPPKTKLIWQFGDVLPQARGSINNSTDCIKEWFPIPPDQLGTIYTKTEKGL